MSAPRCPHACHGATQDPPRRSTQAPERPALDAGGPGDKPGFDRESISGDETEAHSPPLDRVAVLADALDIGLSELIAPLDAAR